MKRIVTLFILILFSGHGYSSELCYEGLVGANDFKNVMDLCIVKDERAYIRMYYLNNDDKNASPAICLAEAEYFKASDETGFEIKSLIGECDNERKMGKFHFSCKPIEAELYGCMEINLKLRFYFSMTKKL